MTLVQIVNAVLVLALPFLIAICYVLAQFSIQRFPTHQRAALEQFTRMAVRHVAGQPEQLDQKGMARLYAIDLFKAYGLPVPSADTLEVAISSAMYELKHG